MCSCTIQTGNKSDAVNGKVGIPIAGVMRSDFFTLLSWAWCINADKVKEAFKARGLDIDANDFPKLVKGHESGNDIKAFGVNFSEIVTNIHFTKEEKEKASCNIILTRPS